MIVADASAVLELLPGTTAAFDIQRRLLESGESLHAPQTALPMKGKNWRLLQPGMGTIDTLAVHPLNGEAKPQAAVKAAASCSRGRKPMVQGCPSA